MGTRRELILVSPSGEELSTVIHGEGRPVVLVHGFPLDGQIWDQQLSELVDSGFQAIVPDLRGFGKSSLNQPYRLEDLARDLEFVSQHIVGAESVSCVGLSMGGYVAFEWWRQQPERIAKLILSNTKPTIDTPAAREGRLAMAQKAIASSTWEAVSPMLQKLLSERTLRDDESTPERVQEMMARVSPQAVAAAQQAMADRRDFSDHLPKISVPTLVIAGELDPIAPVSEGESWSARIPKARFEVIPECGHLPMVEVPEIYGSVLKSFLSE